MCKNVSGVSEKQRDRFFDGKAHELETETGHWDHQPIQGLLVQTDIRAGVGEDSAPNLADWWQNISSKLP